MKAPAFQFYSDDFVAGTCDLSAEEVGCYIRLLCLQWNRGSIPVQDRVKLDRIAGCKVSDDVLAKFCADGKNARLESERDKQAAYREVQRQKGVASGRARLNHGSTTVQPQLNPGSTVVEPSGEPEGNSPSPSPSPSPSLTLTPGNTNTLPSAPPPAEVPPKQELPPPTPPKPADPRHTEFITAWCERRSDSGKTYVMDGGKDGTALKRFLAACKEPAGELIAKAEKAWKRSSQDRFSRACLKAATIHGFCQYYNDITAELATPLTNGVQVVEDMFGSCRSRKF